MGKKRVSARVSAFITHMWSSEARKEKEAKERVRAQTRQCRRVICCGPNAHVYGFVCDAWHDTVAALRCTRVPLHLLFDAHVQTWEEVDEGAVTQLIQRVATDVVFRMRLLDACAAADAEAKAGQACITAYLAREQWAPPPVVSALATQETLQGDVEQAFVAWATRLKEPQRSAVLPHLFVWLHVFLVRAAQTHTFYPLVRGQVRWGAQEALALAQDLMAPQLYSHLAPHMATMGLREPCSPADLAPHLPPTTCGGYNVFLDAVRTAATGGTRRGLAPQSRSRSPPGRALPKGWTRMTTQSLLYPPMYLGPHGQLLFNLSQ